MANASGAARKKSARRNGEGDSADTEAKAAPAKKASESAGEKKAAKAAAVSHEPSVGLKGRIADISKFLKLVRTEMDRVSWPSWKDLRAATIVVVVTLLLVSGYMGLVDWLLTLVFKTPVATGY